MTSPAHPSQPALSDIPRYPASVPLTHERWTRLSAVMQLTEPALAERSYFSLHLWHGGDGIQLSRIGDVLLVQLLDDDADFTLIAMPGAQLRGRDADLVARLLEQRSARFMSEHTAAVLRPVLSRNGLEPEKEVDDADYVYRVVDLAGLSGAGLKDRRQEAERFGREHRAEVWMRPLSDPRAREHLDVVYRRWAASKFPSGVPEAIEEEREGLDGWPRDARADGVLVFGLEADGVEVGVSVVEPMWGRTWMGVLAKTLPELGDAWPYLRRAMADRALAKLGPAGWFNAQQDDGIPGLRTFKRSFRPARWEEKFRVTP